ncbi:MAG: glycosyltransferase family A protein [Lachnospiraceae bacterium]|nr:glycosyltransferase family A protein [Lachnospiraceae bacterium]
MRNGKPELEILCAAMHQKDFSKLKEMNVHCDIFYANQAEREEYVELCFSDYKARMFTTTERGVGKNRNLALEHACGEILLFADEDMVYAEDARERVLQAFKQLPKADIIIFGNHYARNGRIYKTRLPKTEKLHVYKAMRYGTYVIAVRNESIKKAGIRFSELFGGGSIYSLGEDTDFILQCFRKGLKLYTYHYILGTTSKDVSTCFDGYNEKYFFDRGAFARHAFPISAPAYLIYVSRKFGRYSDLSRRRRMQLLIAGYRSYPKKISYAMYQKNR